ncbi:hypothetical protein Droror1_Dr00005938 [Drosera rotundifolia]
MLQFFINRFCNIDALNSTPQYINLPKNKRHTNSIRVLTSPEIASPKIASSDLVSPELVVIGSSLVVSSPLLASSPAGARLAGVVDGVVGGPRLGECQSCGGWLQVAAVVQRLRERKCQRCGK